MRKPARFLVSGALLGVGGLLALYGVFLLISNGDTAGGATYIKVAGGQMDAHLAGGISLAIAAVLVASGVFAARRGRAGGAPSRTRARARAS